MSLPDQIYLRRSHVRQWLGISEQAFTKLVESGVLTPVHLIRGGKAYFKRAEVLEKLQPPNPTPMPRAEAQRTQSKTGSL